MLFGRLFFDEEDINQYSNSELILKELDDIDVDSSMLCIVYQQYLCNCIV